MEIDAGEFVDDNEFIVFLKEIIHFAEKVLQDVQSNKYGNTVSKTDFQGKVLIADIWGTWCPPCREEISLFIELKEKFAGQMDIVGINYERVDEEKEAISKIKDFIEEYQMNYNCVIGDEETKQQIPNFRGYPTTLFIDQKGQVRLTLVGLHSMAKLESVVRSLIDEPGAE